MAGSSVPLWTDPSMWYPQMPDLELAVAEELSEGEADEPYIVDSDEEEPQP